MRIPLEGHISVKVEMGDVKLRLTPGNPRRSIRRLIEAYMRLNEDTHDKAYDILLKEVLKACNIMGITEEDAASLLKQELDRYQVRNHLK